VSAFNWIMLVISATLAVASAGCFALFIALDIDVWLQRARTVRRGTVMALLLWFNIEVWGRVAWTLIHWPR